MISVLIALATALSGAAPGPDAAGEAAQGAVHTARPHSEAGLVLPDFHQVHFLGIDGWTLLLLGIGVCVLGLVFGLVIFQRLKNLPVHESMREISELIYETCKTYLKTQAKFIAVL